MKNKKKVLFWTVVAILLVTTAAVLLLVLQTRGKPDKYRGEMSFYEHIRLQAIPGITKEEIAAVEAIRKQYDTLIFTNMTGTEQFVNIGGKMDGFIALFCEWLTSIFGIPFKPVTSDEWDGVLDGLKNGSIHFTGELTPNEERLKTYFMTSPIVERPIIAVKRRDAAPFWEIAASRPVRYITLHDVTYEADVAANTSYPFEVIYVNTYEEAHELLENGGGDVFVEESTAEAFFGEFEDLMVTNFFPPIFSPVSMTTQIKELESIITAVDKILQHGGIRYLTSLYNKGYDRYKKMLINSWLTEEEKEYVAKNPTVPFVAEYTNYPVSYYDNHHKEWRGISFDVLERIEALTGIRFKRINEYGVEFSQLLAMVENGEAAKISGVLKSAEYENKFLWPATSFFDDSYVLISNTGLRNINLNEISYFKIGLVDGTTYGQSFREWFPNYKNYLSYNNTYTALDALVRGDVDMLMTTKYKLLILTNYRELPDYKVNFSFQTDVSNTFGFNKNDSILVSIVDKALRTIDVGAISDEWLRRTYDHRIKTIEALLPFQIAGVIFMVIISIVVVLLLKKNKESRLLGQQVSERSLELEKQNALSVIINETATFLLETDPRDFEIVVNASLKMLGEYFEVDRVCLWKNVPCDDGRPGYELVATWWDKKKSEGTLPSSASINPYDTIIDMEKTLARADGFVKRRSEFSEKELAYLPPNLQSFAAVPMFLEGFFWGFISLYDCQAQRDFLAGECRSLYSWGLLFTSATQRNKAVTSLCDALDAAESANKMKSVFLANVSHEIRTPMNGIIGFSELAMDDDIPAKTRDFLSKISRSAKGLLEIINNILDLSKIEAGRMKLESIPFELHDVLEHCHMIMMPKAIEKEIMLFFYAEPIITKKLIGDPTRLRQALINLLSNSVKFTNTGTVKLSATVIYATPDTYTLRFRVSDSGIGMTSEKVNSIFDPFVQADDSTTREYGGTGLGLPITKNIVEAMGGKLNVESTLGVGSKFVFDLTFNTIDVPVAAEIPVSNDVIEKPMFGGEEILVCEDNEMNQMVITEHLTKVGLRAVIASNGQIGVDMVKSRIEKGEKPFPLIFMDMHMPVMDGLEAAAAINETGVKTPIVAVTANIMSNDMDNYRKTGINDCLGKPFTAQELWGCLLRYLAPGSKVVQKEGKYLADEKMQKRLRLYFVKENRMVFKNIVSAIESGDIKLAHRLAHTLKGTAGLIEKKQLQDAAAQVEAMLKRGTNDTTKESMDILETEFYAAQKDLEPLLLEEQAAAKEIVEAIPAEKALEIITLLEPLLKTGNSKCLDFINDLKGISGCEKLIELMEDFEFKQAFATLAEIKKGLEI